jgi:hypothetical protein
MARRPEPSPDRLRVQATAAAPFLRTFAHERVNRLLNDWLDPDEEPDYATAIGVRAEMRAIREMCRTYHANVDLDEAALGDDSP